MAMSLNWRYLWHKYHMTVSENVCIKASIVIQGHGVHENSLYFSQQRKSYADLKGVGKTISHLFRLGLWSWEPRLVSVRKIIQYHKTKAQK